MFPRGVYFLANDRLLAEVVAFLNSFRARNPDVQLCLIPYDANTTRIRTLAESYSFSVLDDQKLLKHCDDISAVFHGRVRGHYRKIAAWGGIFEEFIYIDIDTIVLRPVDFVFPLLRDYDVVTAHAGEPGSRKFVWHDTIRPGLELTQVEIDYATNTGFIASKRGLFDPYGIDALVERAKALAPHMELLCMEQPLLNYLLVKSTGRFTSIRQLNEGRTDEKLPCEAWAGDRGWHIEPDGNSSYRGQPHPVLFVHWSGEMVPTKWEKKLYSFLERFGVKTPAMRLNLKQGRLWRHYRDLRKP
jgi:hypothetical protein